jgi:hypothetical protein
VQCYATLKPRAIKVKRAFDSSVRRTRIDYAGIGTNLRLIHSCNLDLVFDRYGRRTQEEVAFPEFAKCFQCSTTPEPQIREKRSRNRYRRPFSMKLPRMGPRLPRGS